MTTRGSFSESLDECIGRVVRGETVEACVRDYPEFAHELREALTAGVAVSEAFSFPPDPDRKRAARLRFHDAVERRNRRPFWLRLPSGGLFGTGQRVAVTALVVLIALAGSGTGTVLAAQSSGPGEVLYPVKRASERVQLALTITPNRESRLRARLMERRIRELEVVTARGHGRFVRDLVAQIERHSARAYGLAIAPVREVVDTFPVLEDPTATPTPDPGTQQRVVGAPPTAAPGRPGLTPGSPARRQVSVRAVLSLSDQLATVRQRIAAFEARMSDEQSKRYLERLRQVMERNDEQLGELLDKADRAHRVRTTAVTEPPRLTDRPADARPVRVRARVRGMEVIHDGKNLLGVDVRVVADEDGTAHVVHLTRKGTRLTVGGEPGKIRDLRLNRRVTLLVDPTSGEILELRIGRTRSDDSAGGEATGRETP